MPSHFNLHLSHLPYRENRYIEILAKAKLAIAGLGIQTTNINYLKSFTVETNSIYYAEYPPKMETILYRDDYPLVRHNS